MTNKLSAWEDGGTVSLQLTDACPFQCPQCYATHGQRELSLMKAEKTLDRFLRNRSGVVQLTGGEPLLYSGLKELISFCGRRRIQVAIATSGCGCTPEHMELFRQNHVHLFVSVNGSSEEINRQTRHGFTEAINLISRLREEGISCSVNWVASRHSIDDLPLFCDFCKGLGVKQIYILRKMPDAKGMLLDAPTSSQIEFLKQCILKNPDFLILESCWQELQSRPTCTAGEKNFYLSCEGYFSPCSYMRKYQYISYDEMIMRSWEWRSNICQYCGDKY